MTAHEDLDAIRDRIDQAKQFQEAVADLREIAEFGDITFATHEGAEISDNRWVPGENVDVDQLVENVVVAAMLVVR